jgi:hypothetical protein
VTRAATYFTRLMPDYVRNEDTTGTLAAFFAGVGTCVAPALRVADLADPDTSVTGTAEIANPAAAPRAWLPWLAYLVGIDLDGVPNADQRDAIAVASALQRRGSRNAIARVVQRTLTGGRSCRVYSNLSGIDPYLITVVTIDTQTPDEPATLLAALSEKPAGADLELQVVASVTFDEIDANFADFDAVEAEFDTFDDLTTYTPPTP